MRNSKAGGSTADPSTTGRSATGRSTTGRHRAGKITDASPIVWFCVSAVVCVTLFFIALSIGAANRDDQLTVINVYCASSVVEPMSNIVDRFNSSDLADSTNSIVKINRVGGSGALAGQLSAESLTGVKNMADIFVCADSNRMSNLIDQRVISQTFPIANQFPVIAIRDPGRSDLIQIKDMQSLLNLEIKLGIGSATSAIGFETRRIAKSNDCLNLLRNRKMADFENVMSLAQALSIGSIDAAIVWDSTVHQFNQTDNPAIKIIAYLGSDSACPESKPRNPQENGSPPKRNYSPDDGFGKFLADRAAGPKLGCFIEVGRSISTNHQADLFFCFLKSNRDENLSDFVNAGFSILPLESSLDNGRESNQP